jgi:hypothetical protein
MIFKKFGFIVIVLIEFAPPPPDNLSFMHHEGTPTPPGKDFQVNTLIFFIIPYSYLSSSGHPEVFRFIP